MMLRLCSQRSAILRTARLLFVAIISELPIVIVPDEPLSFGVACWLRIISSESLHCGHFCVRNYPKPQNVLYTVEVIERS